MGSNFLPCPKCGGHYVKNNLRHHFRFCAKKKDTSRHILQLAQSAAKSVHNRACTRLRTKIIPILKQDDIRNIIRYDLLIILYGNHLCQKHRLEHQEDYIRAQLRLLGRYLQILRQIEPQINELEILFDPKYYDTAIQAVNIIAKYNEETQLYDTPFNASSLGTVLKKLCKILISECIKEHNAEKQKMTEDFQKLLDAEYDNIVSKTVAETQSKRKREKKVELLRSSDITKLNQYLENNRISNMKILQNNFSLKAWRLLAETTLIIIQVFNRRRAGEIERTLISDYKNSIKVTDNDEEYKKLPASEKEAAKKYIRFTIRGKLNRTVPVLLNSKMIDAIETILKYRKMAGVSSTNPYLFRIPNNNNNRSKYLKACKLMREQSAVCGAKNDRALRGTTLCKHIATKCLSLNLSENEVSHVANFMGHHQDIHKQIYRQPVAKIDILDMSKILERAGNTSVHNTTDSSVTENNTTDNTSDTSINKNQRYICTNSNENEILETTEDEDSENEILLPFADTSNENTLKQTNAKKRKCSKGTLSKSDKRSKKIQFTQPNEKIVKPRWTMEEKELAFSLFGEYINKHVLPSFNEITSKIRNTLLQNLIINVLSTTATTATGATTALHRTPQCAPALSPLVKPTGAGAPTTPSSCLSCK
ncbi:PREDICTED: uncharacterized protein LOC105459051 [Wasmannia auropunctata]|uniref:uncharacterized protein LOC105459051 n=1 Tax=Wasmannia auropunctata TaxID=64793 RepID=UPI0005EF179A|nr:PREDICTED: uncharacterized protein LOC105459051 [Wasmannia auropunctata]